VAFRNVIKWQLYDMLVEYTGRQLPWGTLTGIRPVKIITGLLESGSTPEQAKKQFLETYHTTEQKADLSLRVALAEQKILASLDYENQYSIYVGIPFCPSTCLYCSFTSYPIARYQNRVEEYLDALFREIDDVAERMRKRHLISIYIGGGTPTSLSAEQLERLLYKLSTSFDLQYLKECTVEAGRADSITKDKLAVLRKPPVTRISINPQTMQNRTLQFIGRAHSVEQVLATYQMARDMGISNINMDLILGLPNENYEDVCDTLEQICRLAPDNLTIHSLAIKRAAHLNMEREQYANVTAGATDAMLLRADEVATQMGLFPYYLYRQKNIPGNFENVGYAQPGKEGLYNILIMEEKQTIIGLGAGASSKYVMRGDTRIERTENVKEVTQYIDRIAEMIARKDAFLESE
jgi:oxygen-independent coproporphyrinogen-3 oxidase